MSPEKSQAWREFIRFITDGTYLMEKNCGGIQKVIQAVSKGTGLLTASSAGHFDQSY
jgi:hypothetical protein